jgi:hypothetical protein
MRLMECQRSKTLRECWRSHSVTAKSVYDWTATDDPPTRVAMTFWRHEFDDPSLRPSRSNAEVRHRRHGHHLENELNT